PDRAEPGDVHRDRRRRGELPRRHDLRDARSAHPLRGIGEMADHDHAAALERAGANVSGWWSSVAVLARKYPLGAIGAVIMVIFLLTALLAGITGLDPFSTDARSSLARPGGEHILGADFMGRD